MPGKRFQARGYSGVLYATRRQSAVLTGARWCSTVPALHDAPAVLETDKNNNKRRRMSRAAAAGADLLGEPLERDAEKAVRRRARAEHRGEHKEHLREGYSRGAQKVPGALLEGYSRGTRGKL